MMKSPLSSETPLNPCTHALCECTLTPIYHHPLTDHVIILLKATTKRWIQMTVLMMTANAVRGGNDHQRVAVVGILVRAHAQNFFSYGFDALPL